MSISAPDLPPEASTRAQPPPAIADIANTHLCTTCKGSGRKPGSHKPVERCVICAGWGKIGEVRPSIELIAALAKEIEKLVETIDALADDLAEAKNDLEILTDRTGTLETDLTAQDREIADLTARVVALENPE